MVVIALSGGMTPCAGMPYLEPAVPREMLPAVG